MNYDFFRSPYLEIQIEKLRRLKAENDIDQILIENTKRLIWPGFASTINSPHTFVYTLSKNRKP